jgi:hypothetical protein
MKITGVYFDDNDINNEGIDIEVPFNESVSANYGEGEETTLM